MICKQKYTTKHCLNFHFKHYIEFQHTVKSFHIRLYKSCLNPKSLICYKKAYTYTLVIACVISATSINMD